MTQSQYSLSSQLGLNTEYFASRKCRNSYRKDYNRIPIEKVMEKNRLSKQKSKPNYQELEEDQQIQGSSKLNKKIRKNHHKKKGQLSKGQLERKDELKLFLDSSSGYFQQSQQEFIKILKNRLQSRIHIRQVLNFQNTACFKKMKGNQQKQLEVYIELLNAVRKFGSIEKIELISPKNNINLRLRYSRQVIGLNDQGCEVSAVRRILSENEFVLLKSRQQAITQIERLFLNYSLSKNYPKAQVSQDLLQLLSLCKLNATAEAEIALKLDELAHSPDPLYNFQNPKNNAQERFLMSQLMQIFTIKNLQKSFTQAPIDFFNYHKANQYYQVNNCLETPFQHITYISQFKKYALAKKPKSQKGDCYLLRTACSACLTEYSELSNPIENCPECHMRIHRHCQKIENRCHRCRYGRTSNLQKLQSSYCYICNRQREKGLMILTVTNRAPHQFAHNYCLLMHGFWKIENQEFTGQYHRPIAQNHNCIFCQNNQGHFFSCQDCGKLMHGMCAYLNGSSFRMQRRGQDYKVEIKCCKDEETRERLTVQRKFKINYQKIIFREDQQLYSYISQKWMRNQQ